MKTLLVLRHAKSSWKHPELADHDRPLNKRGKGDAPRVGQVLIDRELVPQHILCSTALRTRQTAEAVMLASHYTGKIDYLDALYMAEPQAIVDLLHRLPESVERVLVIGHNPGSEGLVQLLTRQIAALPTAALAHLALPIKAWAELTLESECELVELILPEDKEMEEAKVVQEPAKAKDDKKKPVAKKEPTRGKKKEDKKKDEKKKGKK